MLTVKTEGEYIIPGAWLVPFTSGSQRKCGLTTRSWTHSWQRAPPGSRKPGCPISQMRNPTCRNTNVFIKCDLTPALSHVVWQGLRSAPWWCPWPAGRIALQQLLKSATGFWCWVTQTSAVCGAVGLKDHPQGDRSTDGTETKRFSSRSSLAQISWWPLSQKHLDRELC